MDQILCRKQAISYIQESNIKNKKYLSTLKHTDALKQIIEKQNQFIQSIRTDDYLDPLLHDQVIHHVELMQFQLRQLLLQDIQQIDIDINNGLQLYKSKKYLLEGTLINGIRTGQWNYIWEGELIPAGHYENSKKIGFWREFIDYSQGNLILMEGYYENGLKQGLWTLRSNDEMICQNKYDKGLKQGLCLEFRNNEQDRIVIDKGHYENGLRQGLWKTLYYLAKNPISLGQGNYENGMKEGEWIDYLHQEMSYDIRQEFGVYHQGSRIGIWQTKGFSENERTEMGNYGEQSVKEGSFLEFFYNKWRCVPQCAYGLYKDNNKNGKWAVYQLKPGKQVQVYSHGGEYAFGEQVGEWIQFILNNNDLKRYSYHGFYENGLRQGNWQIWEEDNFQNPKQISGGGMYEDGFKVGEWTSKRIDRMLWFMYGLMLKNRNMKHNYVKGLKHGLSSGIWNKFNQQEIIVQTGKYEFGLRTGYWIEYQYNYQGIFYQNKGNYVKGKKNGIWLAYFEEHLVSEIKYDMGVRVEQCVEVVSQDMNLDYIQMTGMYVNGRREGHWIISRRKGIIGGGNYKNGYKEGRWKESYIDNYGNPIKEQGTYRNGGKINKWSNQYENEDPIYQNYNEYEPHVD